MTRLVLIRHAQASLSWEGDNAFGDYDRLSALGLTQAERLGEELASSGASFDRVYVGPALRHAQTAEAVREVYASKGEGWPEHRVIDELAEHDGAEVVDRALGSPDHDEELVRLVERRSATEPGEERLRIYFAAFQRVMRRWARGELPESVVGELSWPHFRARVARGFETILDESGDGESVAVFTSGGPIGSKVASTLGLSDVAALELGWTVRNATVTEVVRRSGGLRLESYNVQPRLGARELYTLV